MTFILLFRVVIHMRVLNVNNKNVLVYLLANNSDVLVRLSLIKMQNEFLGQVVFLRTFSVFASVLCIC